MIRENEFGVLRLILGLGWVRHLIRLEEEHDGEEVVESLAELLALDLVLLHILVRREHLAHRCGS